VPTLAAASGVWSLGEVDLYRRANIWPGPRDPDFSNVEILLHMDGSGSTFLDSSGTPKTITAGGNATQSTTESMFGGKSAFFDGNGDSLSFADILLGTGNFTIEFWFKTNSSTQYAQMIGNETSGSASGFSLLINNNSSTGGQVAVYRAGSLVVSSSSGDWSDDAWHHVAVVRSGTTITLYLDGTSRGSATDANSYTGSTYFIGRNNVYSGRDLLGYIDELRITKGVRYSAAFTPSAVAFLDA
jgi:hypothetical protein